MENFAHLLVKHVTNRGSSCRMVFEKWRSESVRGGRYHVRIQLSPCPWSGSVRHAIGLHESKRSRGRLFCKSNRRTNPRWSPLPPPVYVDRRPPFYLKQKKNKKKPPSRAPHFSPRLVRSAEPRQFAKDTPHVWWRHGQQP